MIKDAYGNTRFYGIYRGVVVTVHDEGRVSLKVPQILADQVTGLAWPVEPTGSRPNVGDGIWVAFEGGDPAYPIWIGKFKADEGAAATTTPRIQADWAQENSARPTFITNKPEPQEFAVVGGTTGTQPTFTGAPLFTGTYMAIGQQVHFQIQVDMDNITGFGTGQYYLDLPFPAKHNYKFRDGCLHDISASKDYAIGGHVAAGASRMYLFSTDTQSSHVFDIDFDYNSPVTLATADNFHIAGTYIIDEA
jgi:hypothetical protein